MRTPQQILDDIAGRHGMVAPIPTYFPLGPSFTRECVREAYLDLVDALTDVVTQSSGSPAVARAVQPLIADLMEKLKEADSR